MENTIKFLGVLGVDVIEVDNLGGICAEWSSPSQTLTVCKSLCQRKRAEYADQVLSLIYPQPDQ